MENRNGSSTPKNYYHHQQQKQRDEGMLSCWGRFKLKYLYFPWRRRPTLGSSSSSSAGNPPPATGCGNFFGALWGSGSYYRRRSSAAGGSGSGNTGFRYDPIEYAQNFDDGNWNDDDNNEIGFNRGFSSRLAPSPLSSSTCSSSMPIRD